MIPALTFEVEVYIYGQVFVLRQRTKRIETGVSTPQDNGRVSFDGFSHWPKGVTAKLRAVGTPTTNTGCFTLCVDLTAGTGQECFSI